jgi:hypothetical protein
LSVTEPDEELEYILDGNTLRVRLDWGNSWSGDEIHAMQLVTGGQPFSLMIRHPNGQQAYLPSATYESQVGWLQGHGNRSGWMLFNIHQT